MSLDTYKDCLVGEYNQDREAVEFIVKIYELGGEDAIKSIKQNWDRISAAAGLIEAIGKYGGSSAVVKFLTPIFRSIGGAIIDVLVAFILGLGVAVVGLAFIAAESCLPKLAV